MSSGVSSMLFPESNLRLYVSSSLAEIIRLLEGFNGDQNDFDYVLYKMEQLVQVAIRSEEQGLWERVFSNQLLNTLIYVYNQLLEQDVHSFSERSRSAVINTGSVGCPALDIWLFTDKDSRNVGCKQKNSKQKNQTLWFVRGNSSIYCRVE